MKKEGKILALIFLSMFVISVLASVVSALTAGVLDPIKDMFAAWTNGQLSINVAKYIFIILIGLFIFAVLRFVPFLGDNFAVRVISSCLIAFLAGAYLASVEVYLIVSSYSALGATIGLLIPFMVIVAITTELPQRVHFYRNKIFGYTLWGVFTIYSIVKAIVGTILYLKGETAGAVITAEGVSASTVPAGGVSGVTIAILVLVAVFSLIVTVFFGMIFNKLAKVATESQVEEMGAGMRRRFGALRHVLKESVKTGLEAAAGK